ncbi:MAG: FHA domain-containing protein [Atopobiaceae bacterium]|jgi:hypothetical protein|nr:FHA domain-containing protein [Atopobiaceae bacterium]MCI1318652.1 FHA domain-containing protein [Atopobiaceae bacterium]MCI1389081.1 FHA domain-containing protein [Atopobiaceae bacterium]
MADMAGGAGDGRGVRERTRTKVCPRCGARLFEDMSVCYECLYDFDRVPQPLGLPTLDEPDGPLLDGVTASEPGAADRVGTRPWPQPDDELPPDEAWQEEVPDEADLPEAGEEPAWAEPWDELPSFDEEPSEQASYAEGQREADVRRRWPAGASADDTLVAETHGRRQPPMLLVCDEGALAWVPLAHEGVCVGRADDNDVIVTAPTVSRRHLRISPQGDKVLVEDLGAKNHALLDGKPLVGAREVGSGARIELGGVELVIARRTGRR